MSSIYKTTVADEYVKVKSVAVCQQELLETARRLNQMGKQFERFMSIQLQQLEMAIDGFQREREAWHRQRDRELNELEQRKSLKSNDSGNENSSPEMNRKERSLENIEANGDATAPLRMIIAPGSATAMQIGLLLFEISKFNHELGGSGIRFDVSRTCLTTSGRKSQRSAMIGLEAFSFAPLLSYDGAPTYQLQLWNRFKSDILMSSLADAKLQKEFAKTVDAPRDHELRSMAFEATRRAENANARCDAVSEVHNLRFYSQAKIQNPTRQQIQRVEEVVSFLKRECGLRIHVSLVW